ncbi:MAG: alkaline phosphatase family protein [Chloroflexi bacterium]|nr:alkaline phosphatase family protein [Chloroflexota bacterium]
MLDPAFIKPTYDGRCFPAIPHSIAGLLGAPQKVALAPEVLEGLAGAYDAVVLFLVDAFGWRFFEKYADDYPALRRFRETGVATRLTAQFPSTTASHITCLHTGLDVGQSGVYEWQYYEPQLDAVITPLLFSYAGTTERDQLKAAGVDPRRLYPRRTLYHALGRQGIASYVFQHRAFTPSTFSNMMFAGATIVLGYKTLPEALINLRALLGEQRVPSYYVLYFGDFDGIGHEYGPNSAQLAAELDAFLTSLERLFLRRLKVRAGQGLFLLTADHGLVETNPAATIYLNTDRAFSGIERYLRTDRQGRTLVPGGSARDAFLYVRAGMLDEAQAFLAQRLTGRAVAYRAADMIEAGFFGSQPPSPEFLGRVGDLVILPYRGEAVWWYEKDRFEQKFYGHHGGLTPQEMEIPLLACAF